MSYPAGEVLVLAKLIAISGGAWVTGNTSRANWTMLNSGNYDHYAVLKEGPGGTAGFISTTTELRNYSCIIQVWQSYQADGTSATNLQAYGEAIRTQFKKYRKLGDTTGTIEDSACKSWSEVQERWEKGGGLRWLKQDFVIEWQEENNDAFAE